MGLKQILPGHGQGGGGTGDPVSDEQLEQIGGVANDAKTLAQAAKTESAAAGAKADAAKTAADGYSTQIANAVSKADAAKTAADAASAAAAAASGKADGVSGTASDAKTKAEAAQSAAATAGTKADAAKTTADGLDSRVTVAENKATAAKTAADAATAAAGTASTKADNAKTAADQAKAIATQYETRISDVEATQGGYTQLIAEATATANEANTAALNAKQTAEDLDDAITAAGTKADTAKTAADAAKVSAAEAKVTAGQALTKATEAKTEADALGVQMDGVINTAETAVTKAEEAKTLATQVGTNVTDIQNDVATLQDDSEQTNVTLDDLSQRMLTAETDIDALQAGGGGGGGPAYDDTEVKGRLDAVESKNTSQDQSLATINATLSGLGAGSVGRYVSLWGDSRTAQNWSSSTNPNTPAPLARSWAWWSEALSMGRVRMTHRYNFGVSGDSIAQLRARMEGDVANAAGVKPSQVPAGPAVVLIGTNTIKTGTQTVAQMMADVNAIVAWLQNKGHIVFLVAEWPRGLNTTDGSAQILTADTAALMYAYRKELLALNTKKGVYVVNPWDSMIDPTKAALGQPLTGMVNIDGLHNCPANGFLTGKRLAAAYERAGLKRSCFGDMGVDLWTAVNTKGVMNKNPNFVVGTGGSVQATGGTIAGPTTNNPAIPQDWSLSVQGGMTALGSFVNVTMEDGTIRPAYRVVVSGTAGSTAQNMMLRQSSLYDAAKIAAGDVLEGFVEYRVAAGHKNLAAMGISITNGVSASTAYGGLVLTGDPQMHAQAAEGFTALAQTNEFTVTTATALNFELRAYFCEAVDTSLTVDFFCAGVRKKVVA